MSALWNLHGGDTQGLSGYNYYCLGILYKDLLLQSRHQISDGLAIWRCSHIPQKDGEVDMMLTPRKIQSILQGP
jgi:hypothetical protein